MKLITKKIHTVEVTSDEISSLLSKLIEKKTGKKVVGVGVGDGSSYVFDLTEESEESNLDEHKA